MADRSRPAPSVDALRSLLAPTSIAVVGASEAVFTFSGAPVHNLSTHGFAGIVHPVNPKRREVNGLPCFPNVIDIPDPVDTAVITVPAPAVVEVLEQCEQRGILSATVVSAGFGEDGAGDAGQTEQRRLEEFLARSRLRVLGPNTAGLMNLLDGYVPRAAANHLDSTLLNAGSVALITQSGACSNIVFNRAQAHGVGVGLMAATGGECDISVWDLVDYAVADERITVVMVVIEALGDSRYIKAVAERARAARKPIVLLKLGSSELGSEVVLTHSGSIAGDVAVARAAFAQWGIVQVDDFDSLWQTARLFEAWGTPDGPTGSLGVFAFSGGEAALIADHAADTSLTLATVSADFDANIRSELAFAKAANPFDATGELVGRPEKLIPVLSSFLDDNTFTEVLVATPVYRAEAAERVLPQLADLLEAQRPAGPRLVFSMWPAGPLTERQAELLRATGQPVLPDSSHVVAAIDRYCRYLAQAGTPRPRPRSALGGPLPAPAADVTYAEARAVLEALGLPFAPGALVATADEAVAVAADIGSPVALKGNVPSSVHKAKAGLVAIGVSGEADVRATFETLAGRSDVGAGVFVEAMVAASIQCFVGARRDPDFGPIVVFGLGGSAANFLEDSAIVVGGSGANPTAALAGTRVGSFLLSEYPGAASILVGVLEALMSWLETCPQVTDVDLNPVMVDTTQGTVTCVDARIVVEEVS